MKQFFSFLCLVCCATAFISCSPESGSPTPEKLRFVTGGEAGTYYALGAVIAQHATNNAGISVINLAGNGSQANILALEDNTAELAFSQSDVMSYAYKGTNLFAGSGKITSFSVVGALYNEQVQIVTTNPAIVTVADLKGKSVSIGAAGSGVYFNALDILKVYDLTLNDITPTYQSFGDSTNALRDGKIDAAFIVAGAPTNAITDLATTRKINLVALDQQHIDKLIAISPFYSQCTIKSDVYGTDRDTLGVCVSAVLIARNTLPAPLIYSLCADIFDNAPSQVTAHAKFSEITREFGASIKSVPYHPGAVRYFTEKGFTVLAQD